jgi:hypothetical protein
MTNCGIIMHTASKLLLRHQQPIVVGLYLTTPMKGLAYHSGSCNGQLCSPLQIAHPRRYPNTASGTQHDLVQKCDGAAVPSSCRCENLLALELDVPERSTFDIIPGVGPDPRAQAAIDAAFWEDGLVLVVGGAQKMQHVHLLGPQTQGVAGGVGFIGQKGQLSPQSAAGSRPRSGQQRRPGSARVTKDFARMT